MPGVASLDALQRAVNEFDITAFHLDVEPAALAAARQSLDESGLLLLGEAHGVRQNPLIARELMVALDVTALALEWPAGLASAASGFFGNGYVPDHPQLWGGDGRITVGHFALLRERFMAEGLEALTLFDGVNEVGWSRREAAMADRILSAQAPRSRTLVIAGNAHTALSPTGLGIPLGARLAERRPGVREIRINYGNGSYYNLSPQRFKRQWTLRRRASYSTCRARFRRGCRIGCSPTSRGDQARRATPATSPRRTPVGSPRRTPGRSPRRTPGRSPYMTNRATPASPAARDARATAGSPVSTDPPSAPSRPASGSVSTHQVSTHQPPHPI